MADTFGKSSATALELSSSETSGDEFVDFHSHVEPIYKLLGPRMASHASDNIEGPSPGYALLIYQISDKQEYIMNVFLGISKENNNAPHSNALGAKNSQNYPNICIIGSEGTRTMELEPWTSSLITPMHVCSIDKSIRIPIYNRRLLVTRLL